MLINNYHVDLEEIEKLTIGHYENNAESFRIGTKDHDVSQNIVAFLGALLDEATIGDSFEDALAVLVTSACVTKAKSSVEALKSGVRFIDDHRRAIRPLLELLVKGFIQRNVAVKRLLDEKESAKKITQFVGSLYSMPEGLKVGDGLELFIAIQREGKI